MRLQFKALSKGEGWNTGSPQTVLAQARILATHKIHKHFIAFKNHSDKFIICGSISQSLGTTWILVLCNKRSRVHRQNKRAEKSISERGPGNRLCKLNMVLWNPQDAAESWSTCTLLPTPKTLKCITRLVPSTHLANGPSEKSVKSLLKTQICYRNSIKSKLIFLK